MKLALPLTEADSFSPHYGASTKFMVVDVDQPRRTVRRRMMVVPGESEPCQWPRLLRAAGVRLMIVSGMGWGARQRMGEHGIEVLAGVPVATPDELIAAWLNGRLIGGVNACDGHGPHRGGLERNVHG